MKKILAIVLVFVLIMAIPLSASAAGTWKVGPNGGDFKIVDGIMEGRCPAWVPAMYQYSIPASGTLTLEADITLEEQNPGASGTQAGFIVNANSSYTKWTYILITNWLQNPSRGISVSECEYNNSTAKE